MMVLAAAQTATVSVRVAYAPLAALENEIAGSGFLESVTALGTEIGADVRASDTVRLGVTAAIATLHPAMSRVASMARVSARETWLMSRSVARELSSSLTTESPRTQGAAAVRISSRVRPAPSVGTRTWVT